MSLKSCDILAHLEVSRRRVPDGWSWNLCNKDATAFQLLTSSAGKVNNQMFEVTINAKTEWYLPAAQQ